MPIFASTGKETIFVLKAFLSCVSSFFCETIYFCSKIVAAPFGYEYKLNTSFSSLTSVGLKTLQDFYLYEVFCH